MANSLMDMLKGQLTETVLSQLAQNIGGANQQQTNVASQGIMSTLIGALANNASTQEGASSLFNAVEKDHDGSILDNMMDFLQPEKQNPVPERTVNGPGILNHLLGDKQGGMAEAISKLSGLDAGSVGSLMQTLAPVVMGMIGKQKQQNNLDSGGLMNLLNNERQVAKQQENEMSPFMRLLDMDGDGSVMDDVGGLLAKFMKK